MIVRQAGKRRLALLSGIMCGMRLRTIGDDIDAVRREACTQDCVLFAGVGDTDCLMYIRQHALEKLCRQQGRLGARGRCQRQKTQRY